MKATFILFFLSCSIFSYSQVLRESELRNKMDQGAILMEQGQYDSAQALFKVAIAKMKKLPSDLAYYFGRNSYHLKKYKQSINWLNKYIQLKGTKGRYYEYAVKYLQFAEEEYLQIQRRQVSEVAKVLDSEEDTCDGLTKMLCPVCHGSGVVITTGLFNEAQYNTCPYSLGEGFISCEEYNAFMKGLLAPKLKN